MIQSGYGLGLYELFTIIFFCLSFEAMLVVKSVNFELNDRL